MNNMLIGFVIIVGVIVVSSIFNEKKLHVPDDIALLIFSTILGVLLLICRKFGFLTNLVNVITNIKFDNYLLECTLCFMIFAGASKIHFNKFIENMVPISLLAIFTTITSSLIYGGMFYLISMLLGVELNIWICLLLGIIISPTDPIAATGILSKLGLSKSVISTIEGESLLNDGIGVALFVFVKGIITNGVGENFFFLMFKEIMGAFAVGMVISFVLFKLVKVTNKPIIHILISLLDVSLSYVICEHFGFSGVIASVICGMYFSYEMNKISRWKTVVDAKNLYEDFWHIIETLLNSVLFVLVGFSIISMEFTPYILILIPIAVILNLIARGIGVLVSTLLLKKKRIPSKYNLKEFVMLLTWTGLKGGMSLALALSVKNILSEESFLILLNSTVIIILFTTIIQGLTTNKVYNYIEKIKEKRIEGV